MASQGIAQTRPSVGVRVPERQHRTAIACLSFDSYLVRAETALEQIGSCAALVGELDREKGAEIFRYRKAVAGLGVENINDVLGIVVKGAEGEISIGKKPAR